jgi:hypothetical protein
VTVVSPYQSESKTSNVKEIIVEDFYDEYIKPLSKAILTGNTTEWQIYQHIQGFMTPVAKGFNSALNNTMFHDLLKPGAKFDVTLTMAMGGGELGYYIAHRLNSSLVLYFAQQMSVSTQNHALGQPHNPSYIPFIGRTYQ